MRTLIIECMNGHLPHMEGLDIAALARTLDNPNSSYKFLWLLSLLEIIGENGDEDGTLRIEMIEVVNRMVEKARDPVWTYRLHLGKDDRMGEILKKRLSAQNVKKDEEKADRWAFNRLKRYVPQQWLRPFSEKGMSGFTSYQVAQSLLAEASSPIARARARFPYTFHENEFGSDILVSGRWRRYFQANYKIVEGWALYAFIDYLQQNNPSTPGIVAKIARPWERENLNMQRDWWKEIIRLDGRVQCIYSGEKLSSGDFQLDHYVPWSFVGHNRIWNLVPVIPDANQQKKDRLPDQEYLDRLIRVQRRALSTHVNRIGRRSGAWNRMFDAYSTDLKLKIKADEVRWGGSIKKKFNDVFPPLLALAESNGFQPGWKWRKPARKLAV